LCCFFRDYWALVRCTGFSAAILRLLMPSMVLVWVDRLSRCFHG
jgi:hypothetical protein